MAQWLKQHRSAQVATVAFLVAILVFALSYLLPEKRDEAQAAPKASAINAVERQKPHPSDPRAVAGGPSNTVDGSEGQYPPPARTMPQARSTPFFEPQAACPGLKAGERRDDEFFSCWAQVVEFMENHPRYVECFDMINGTSIEKARRLAQLEKEGWLLRDRLEVGETITNSEGFGVRHLGHNHFRGDCRALPGFRLRSFRYVLTDQGPNKETPGKPLVMTLCGNPVNQPKPQQPPPPPPPEGKQESKSHVNDGFQDDDGHDVKTPPDATPVPPDDEMPQPKASGSPKPSSSPSPSPSPTSEPDPDPCGPQGCGSPSPQPSPSPTETGGPSEPPPDD